MTESVLKEKYESGRVTVNKLGITGERTFQVDWEYRLVDANGIPQVMIDDWFDADNQELKCCEINYEGYGGIEQNTSSSNYGNFKKCIITARYSTYEFLDDLPTETWEFGGEVLETGLGRHWLYGGTANDQAQGVYYPNIIRSITFVWDTVPVAEILLCQGKVNSSWFQTFPPETLLFEGATIASRADYERGKYLYTITYKFLYRSLGHNVVWRAPRQARDDAGNLLFETGTGDPEFVSGAAGIGGWDRTVPALYETANFNPIFGWPSDQVNSSVPPWLGGNRNKR